MEINTTAASAQAITSIAGSPLMKRATNLEGQAALALVNAIQTPQQTSTANLPPNLGQNINTTA